MTAALPPLWPASVPMIARAPVTGQAPDNRVAFRPSVGNDLRRPLLTGEIEPFTLALQNLRQEQFETFRDWVRDDLKKATLTFAWVHPVTQDVRGCRFQAGRTPYEFQWRRPWWRVSVHIEVDDWVPGWASSVTTANGFLEEA